MKNSLSCLLFFFLVVTSSPFLFSHCEVPCGIYNDQLRLAMIEEHIMTIEKAITQIIALSIENPQNMNQIVRWIMNKEHHAEEIQHIISQYFLTQRLKPTDKEDSGNYPKLIQNLQHCHEILVLAMKTKQSTDLENVEALKQSVKNFSAFYFGKAEEPHTL